ncbi:MAG: 16S rRNA (adenine(1518)-N(6)/adenine(1519)-N(6))-dimethyltransferase RsmA [Myxococcota bacterium]
MTDPLHPRVILAALEQRARRRFGQHFLVDRGVVDRIVRGARVASGDRVVEIGPGLGILTRALVEAGAALTAVEIDRDLADHLRTTFPSVTLVEGDAAKVDWGQVCPGTGWKVVANLPYNVGTTLTMQLIRRPSTFASVTVMLQREVVHRLCAEPGSRTYGALSVEAQARARVTYLMPVPPDRFHPPPKVDSAVIRLEPYPEPDLGGVPAARFDQVVRAAFSQRRKTAHNALGAVFGRDRVRDVLAELGVEPMARAEQLDLDTYRRLAARLVTGSDGDDPVDDQRYGSEEEG